MLLLQKLLFWMALYKQCLPGPVSPGQPYYTPHKTTLLVSIPKSYCQTDMGKNGPIDLSFMMIKAAHINRLGCLTVQNEHF